MHATPFEYRHRFLLHGLLYLLGFVAPWTYLAVWPAGDLSTHALHEPAWLALSTLLYRQGWLSYNAAVLVLLIIALLFTGLGAAFRTWGAAYVGSSIVKSSTMHGETLLADGPYRHTRNPLYLGTLLHTLGISLLMPPSGAIFDVVLLWIFQVRLALAEEPFLTAKFGAPYIAYKNAVPRFLPIPEAQVPSANLKPKWTQSLLGELYFLGAFLTLAIFGWSFDRNDIYRGLLISLGASIIARAFLPQANAPTED